MRKKKFKEIAMALYTPVKDDRFDIGEGLTRPDAGVMETGRVPVSAYTSDARYELEREMFGKLWLLVGRTEQISSPGDWFVRDVECHSASAIIVRGKDDKVRAFHNICSHRGMRLVWGSSGRGGKFSCPYHAWLYDSSGALAHVPDAECFTQFNKADNGLTPIHCDVWEGFIFINLAQQPTQTLAEFLGPLGERLAGAPFSDFTRVCTLSQEVVGNWKLGIEAASEGYHVQALHAKTVGGLLSTKDNPHVRFVHVTPLGPHRCATVPCNPDYRLPENRIVQRFAQANAAQMMVEGGQQGNIGGTFLSHPAINPLKSDLFANEQFNLFPNTSLHISLGGYWMTSYWPITKELSRWRSTFFFRTPRSHAEEFSIQAAMGLSRDIFAEDNSCFQKQQAALASGGKSHVIFAESEMMLRHHIAVIQGIEDNRKNPVGPLAVAAA
jgi:phenylpropionate dioxygenase-like ring-hydroxylating dioxygenase large terminal subunit